MRRALAGTVPEELLNRKRKAYVDRAPRIAISTEWPSLAEISQQMVGNSLGIVHARAFCKALHDVQKDHELPIVSLMRTLTIERWLRNVPLWRLMNTRNSDAKGKEPVLGRRQSLSASK
jgi:hypothetical protein